MIKLFGGKKKPGQKRRFPWIALRSSPRVGQKYELTHLEPLARQLFERLSQITEIPVKDLLPWRGKNSIVYNYDPRMHSLSHLSAISPLWFGLPFEYLVTGAKTSPTTHEAIHSINNLVSSERESHVNYQPLKGLAFWRSSYVNSVSVFCFSNAYSS